MVNESFDSSEARETGGSKLKRNNFQVVLFNYLDDIGLLKEVQRHDLYQMNDKEIESVLRGYERHNVEVQSGYLVRLAP